MESRKYGTFKAEKADFEGHRSVMTCAETKTVEEQIVLACHCNQYDRLYGGQLLYWLDSLGSLAALKYCACDGVTAAVDNVSFIRGFSPGQCLEDGVLGFRFRAPKYRGLYEGDRFRSQDR